MHKLNSKFDELDKLYAEFDELHKLNSKFDELDKLHAEFDELDCMLNLMSWISYTLSWVSCIS